MDPDPQDPQVSRPPGSGSAINCTDLDLVPDPDPDPFVNKQKK